MTPRRLRSRGRSRLGPFGPLLCVALTLGAALAAPSLQSSSTVGVPAELNDVVLPGSELVAAPADFTSPIVLRVLASRPHGDAFRYDLSWYGLEPGEFDLAAYLRRRDGTAVGELPGLAVTVKSLLPPGQVEPHRPEEGLLPRLGGYRAWLWVLGILWAGGLFAILFVGRPGRREEAAAARPRTLADRLRPLVEDARRGELSEARRGELELLLIAFWRRRLGLEQLGAARALSELRGHPEAGPLLRQLEAWLHQRESDRTVSDEHLRALLAPYERVAEDALDAPGAAGGRR